MVQINRRSCYVRSECSARIVEVDSVYHRPGSGIECHLNPVGAIAASPLPPQEMRAHLDTLKRLTEAEGRDFSALTISYKAPLYDASIPDRDGTRRSFSGSPDEIAKLHETGAV